MSTIQPDVAHPLLGEQVSPGVFEVSLDLTSERHRWIPDHEIFRYAVLPGTAYPEIGLAVAATLDGEGPHAVEDVVLHKAMFLSTEEPSRMRVEVTEEAAYRVLTLHPGNEEWDLNAEGRVVAGGPPPDPIDLDELEAGDRERIAADEHYAEFRRRGANYGHAFQGVVEVLKRDRDCLAVLDTPTGIDIDSYGVHPGVLDSAIQIPAMHVEDAKGRMWLPLRMARYQVWRKAPRDLLTHATSVPMDEPRRLRADVLVTDREGVPVAKVSGLLAKRGGRK